MQYALPSSHLESSVSQFHKFRWHKRWVKPLGPIHQVFLIYAWNPNFIYVPHSHSTNAIGSENLMSSIEGMCQDGSELHVVDVVRRFNHQSIGSDRDGQRAITNGESRDSHNLGWLLHRSTWPDGKLHGARLHRFDDPSLAQQVSESPLQRHGYGLRSIRLGKPHLDCHKGCGRVRIHLVRLCQLA